MPVYFDTPYTVKTSTRFGNKRETFNFESSLQKLCTLKTIENMNYFLKFVNFEKIESITDICIFKEGIEPLWEDPSNINGGKWIIKLKREVTIRLFQKLLVHLLVNSFDTIQVNGIVISFRMRNCIITLWTSSGSNSENAIQEIKKVLNIDFFLSVEYKDNSHSLKDMSSFRNTKNYQV